MMESKLQVASNKKVRCMNFDTKKKEFCGHVFTEESKHLENAGSIEGKRFYNTRCPECGACDTMHEDYVDERPEQYQIESMAGHFEEMGIDVTIDDVETALEEVYNDGN